MALQTASSIQSFALLRKMGIPALVSAHRDLFLTRLSVAFQAAQILTECTSYSTLQRELIYLKMALEAVISSPATTLWRTPQISSLGAVNVNLMS